MIILSNRIFFFCIILGILVFLPRNAMVIAMGREDAEENSHMIQLPSPILKGTISVEEAVNARRTRRNFSDQALTLKEWGQILWAAQGITSDGKIKKRAAPSAGALYPIELYLILSKGFSDSIPAGIFHYVPTKHALEQISDKNFAKEVAKASLHQYWMAEASGMILITAEYSRITGKYGKRGIRYAHIEAGHVAQNCLLQAESLNLKVGIVGAFEDQKLMDLLPIPKTHEPILILPMGRSR